MCIFPRSCLIPWSMANWLSGFLEKPLGDLIYQSLADLLSGQTFKLITEKNTPISFKS